MIADGEVHERVAPRVVAWGDYTCPFSYIAEIAVLARLLDEEGMAVEWRPYELWPAPAPLPMPADAVDADRWETTLLPLADDLGLELRRPQRVPRTRKAHEAVAYAAEHELAEALRRRLFRAHFVDGRDIGRLDELAAIGAEVGLNETGVRIALDLDQYAERVAMHEVEAAEAGVKGVPALLVGEELLIGLHPYETVLGLVRGDLGDWRMDG